MQWRKSLWCLALLGGTLLGVAGIAKATALRQYYGGWTYYPQSTYYYRYYYYKPYDSYDGYQYHYCIYYTSQPRYVYYYNPQRQVYWGRLDTEAKGDEKYSLLEDKDRKKELKDIPEKAFPKPAKMPKVPDAKDDITIETPPNDLPKNDLPDAK